MPTRKSEPAFFDAAASSANAMFATSNAAGTARDRTALVPEIGKHGIAHEFQDFAAGIGDGGYDLVEVNIHKFEDSPLGGSPRASRSSAACNHRYRQ
jgi:hypothetical protein